MSSIIFVEHDVKQIPQVRKFLGDDFEVEPAFNGWDGLGAILMYKPDLVIFNLAAPVMTGVEALRLLRTEESSKNLPVLGFTTPRHEAIEQVSLESGCTEILPFPFDHTLRDIVCRHLMLSLPQSV